MVHTLLPDQTHRLEVLTERGKFASADQAIGEAISLLEQQIALRELRAKIDIGSEQANRGEQIEYVAANDPERKRRALARLAGGEKPSPDVCP